MRNSHSNPSALSVRLRMASVSALCLATLLLSACKINPDAAIQIANRMEATRRAGLPTETPAPPQPFLALCLVKSQTKLTVRQAPDNAAKIITQLQNRDVFSVYLRSENAEWVYGYNAKRSEGWVSVKNLGCTVPIEDLVVPTPTPLPTPNAAQANATGTAQALITPLVTPTTLPVPATPTPLLTPVLAPTEIAPIATVAPTELQCSVQITNGLNVRRGPGTNFGAFIKLNQGQVFNAVVRSPDGRWLGGRTPDGQRGWVIALSVLCNGDFSALPLSADGSVPDSVIAIPPTPAPVIEPSPTPPPQVAQATAPPAANTVQIECRVVVTTGLNVRNGPAKTFAVLSVALTGERFNASGRTANNAWLFGTSETGTTGWVIAGGTRCQQNIRRLPAVNPQTQQVPTPTPAG